MKRLALALALVLSVVLSAPVLAADGRMWEDDGGVPIVVTDPVHTMGDPSTDPVRPLDPWWGVWNEPPRPLPQEVETAGEALVGTYVGEVGKRRYIPAFQYQLLYSDPQGGYSCTAYSAAMAVDKATYGGSRVTGREVRALSGVSSYSGMSLADVKVATDKLQVSLIRATGTWADVLVDLRQGRGVILQGVYSQVPTSLSGQPSFTGRHAVYLDYLHSTGLYVYVMDPLSKVGPRWWPVEVLQRFADKLGRETGIYPLVFYSYTRVTRLMR